MNEAIKLGIEKGGYYTAPLEEQEYDIKDEQLFWYGPEYPEEGSTIYTFAEIVLGPLFWQSLGKALGWPDETHNGEYWQVIAHDYFQLVLTGGDTEAFWRNILH
ncbi:MAG TPA: hypothetical protein VK421_02945 [Pyrinomonadaceae bacterium]|nr:hypothetical protein [Pyrinomonadaceae bacterium]